ncbi:MAG: hypothetical protein IPI10_03640 [Bacteroidetes bacterium]|nr:hypothetical protein [Bacteroidota bacterium]
MKLLTFLLLSISALAQNDSTTLHFQYTSSSELAISNELNGIQYISIVSRDTLMHDKQFLLSMKEYKNGKQITEDHFGLNGKVQNIPIINGTDTSYYTFNPSDKVKFPTTDSIFAIQVAGRLEEKDFLLKVNYPGIRFTRTLKGNSAYSLREVQCSADHDLKIPINSTVPVLAYTLPFETGQGGNFYCILGSEEVEKWYTKFKVKHYYVFFIEVR